MSPWVPLLSASCSILFTPMVYIEHIFDGSYLTLQVLCWIWNLVQRVKPPDGDFPSSGPPLPPCAPICSSWPSGSLLQAGGPSRTVTLIGRHIDHSISGDTRYHCRCPSTEPSPPGRLQSSARCTSGHSLPLCPCPKFPQSQLPVLH